MPQHPFQYVGAEGEGFEPSIPCGMHAFQACALDHYANPPNMPSIRHWTQNMKSGPPLADRLFLYGRALRPGNRWKKRGRDRHRKSLVRTPNLTWSSAQQCQRTKRKLQHHGVGDFNMTAKMLGTPLKVNMNNLAHRFSPSALCSVFPTNAPLFCWHRSILQEPAPVALEHPDAAPPSSAGAKCAPQAG